MMKKVYVAEDQMMVFHYKNILENYGINCLIKNLHLSGALGEIPPNECMPELWVLDDSDYEQAKTLIQANQNLLQSKEFWICENCHEKIEAQFGQCWKCGKIA